MNSETDLSKQQDTIQQRPTNSFKSLKLTILLAIVLFVAVVAGISGYLLGLRTNQNTSQSNQKISSPPSPKITMQSTIPNPSSKPTQTIPTINGKIYRNEKLGFEFKYFEGYEVMEETTNGVSFGFGGFPYLTISTNQITNYKSLRPCKYSNEVFRQTFPCLESGKRWGQKEDIIETKLGQIDAEGFYIAEGFPDASYHIVQTNYPPKIEAKMFISGGGLDSSSKQMLSTFRILDNM